MKHIKLNISLILLVLFSSINLSAQNHQGSQRDQKCRAHRQQIKSERVAFITDALSLSVEEAQKFWPVYNDYNKKVDNLRDQKHSEMTAIRSKGENISEKEYQKFIERYIFFIESETALKKGYQKDLLKTFTPKKIYLLYKAEKDFKRNLVKGLRGKRPACME